MLKLAVLTTFAVAALPAMAAEYVKGVDYQPCVQAKNYVNDKPFLNCSAPNTQQFYQDVYTNSNGVQMVRQVQGYVDAHCGNNSVCSVRGDKTYSAGSFIGNAPQGDYVLTYNFYLGEDYNGEPVAYVRGRGPQFNEDPAGNPWASEKGGAPVAPGSEAWDEENE
ncbi:hypothetical protein D9M69_562300 [compost metagenome]